MNRIILNKLIRSNCELARFSKVCPHCSLRRSFGRELLMTLSEQVDSPIGWYSLNYSLLNNGMDRSLLIRITTSSLILIRNKNKSKLYRQFKPVETLLELLNTLILEFGNHRGSKDGEEISELCWDVISCLSTLINKRGICERSGIDESEISKLPATFLRDKNYNQQVCQLANDITDTLKFNNKKGELIVEISKERLCASSEYFGRMFQNDFVEAVEDRKNFTFDEDLEKCSQDDFLRFVHLCSGCSPGNKCVKLESAETFTSIFFLADKYICTCLLDTLFMKKSLIHARSMVNGDSLRFFLLLSFNVPHIAQYFQSICILVLLRFTNFEQLKETISCVSSNAAATKMLICMISEFLSPFTEPSNPIEQQTSYMDF